MPLLDHFHSPLSESRSWESFHTSWSSEIMAALNQEILPPGYFAETQVHFGSRLEVDVATLHEEKPPSNPVLGRKTSTGFRAAPHFTR